MATIIYPPTINFDWLYQRPQQILTSMSKLGYKIYYCNKNFDKRYQKGLVKLFDNFYILNGIDIDNIKIFEPPIIWISFPPNYVYINKYKKKFIVFDSIDYPSDEFTEWTTNFRELQKESNVIFASSKKLYDLNKKFNRHVYQLQNGTDFDHFNKAKNIYSERPIDLPDAKPIVGYYGALATWIDWNLVDFISYKHPELNFVFIGPNLNVPYLPMKDNIFYLGEKRYKDLPDYLQYFDACILPFKLTKMTEGSDPIKVYEYISAGKIVVSTKLPEVEKYNGIFIANSNEEFSDMIERAINDANEGIKERLIDIAKDNSWEKRAITADRIIKYYLI